MIIWLTSYPKSGNTWVRSFLVSLLYNKKNETNLEGLNNIPQYPLRSHFNNLLDNIDDINEVSSKWIISQKRINKAQIENNLSNIAIVGDKMKSKKGISGKLFSSLGHNNINIRAIAQGASERNISIIIDKKNTKKALIALHKEFKLDNKRRV